MRSDQVRRFMKKFVLKTVLCGRSKEKRLERKEESGNAEASSTTKGAKKKEGRHKIALRVADSYCACCLKPFVIDRGVRCIECGARICKKKCSRLEQQYCNCWCCLFCYQQRTRQFRTTHWLDTYRSHNFKSRSLWDPDKPSIYAGRFAADATSMAYTALHKLVDRAVDEVCKLSNSKNSTSNNICDDEQDQCEELTLSGRNYDDLLKTIIVNKVIEKSGNYQSIENNNNSNMKHVKDISEIVPRDQNYNNSLEIVTRDRRDSEYNHVACKFTQTHTYKSLSLMIEERIEEVETCVSDQYVRSDCENYLNIHKSHRVPFPELGMDIIDPCEKSEGEQDEIDDPEHTKFVSLVDSWKDNWYFRKKKIKQDSKFVSMFVPNSNTKYRAMIGDKNIDETSDLSECSNNSEEETETELTLPIKSKSLNLCNGDFNEIPLVNSKSQSNCGEKIVETMFSNGNISTMAKTIIPIKKDLIEEKSNIMTVNQSISINSSFRIKRNTIDSSLSSEIEDQQDSEYTEQDVCLTERHCFDVEKYNGDSCCKEKTINGIHQPEVTNELQAVHNHCISFGKENSPLEIQLNTPPKPGSIAEREHKKWENATSIKNNPYSKENIQKRLLEKKYLGPFNLSRFRSDGFIDYPIVSNRKRWELVESDDLNKFGNDVNCSCLNSNASNLEIQDKIEITKSNSVAEQDLKFIPTNSEKSQDNTICNISTNLNMLDIIQVVDESSLSRSTKNNEISEHDRKNNKNEIHAKLNNQEQIFDGICETIQNKQSLCIENKNSSTCQTDLRACIFEKNELPKIISSHKSPKQQVVNILDIKPIDHLENIILTTHSKNKLVDKTGKEIEYKLNLMKKNQFESINSLKNVDIDGDLFLSNRTKNNVTRDKDISDVKSLKNTPCKLFSAVNNEQTIDNKLTKYKNQNKCQEMVTAEKLDETQDLKNANKNEKSDVQNMYCLSNDSKTNQDFKILKDFSTNCKVEYAGNCIQRKLSMPSVKKLVQVFDSKHQEKTISTLMVETKLNTFESKETEYQQINVNQLPRQLHSLTARSLSKEFRDGLRQIPNKTNINN